MLLYAEFLDLFSLATLTKACRSKRLRMGDSKLALSRELQRSILGEPRPDDYRLLLESASKAEVAAFLHDSGIDIRAVSKADLVEMVMYRIGFAARGHLGGDMSPFFARQSTRPDDYESPQPSYRGDPLSRCNGVAHPELRYCPVDANQPLRDYQVAAQNAILRALNERRPQLLHLGTGGGKTRVANAVVSQVVSRGGCVLWMTKDWELLAQAAVDYARRNQGAQLGRIGAGNKNPIMRALPEDEEADVCYTTIRTLSQRLYDVNMRRFSLVVWDECHWGENGQTQDVLDLCLKLRIPVLGLTATPRSEENFSIAFSKSFFELIREGYLARPVIETPVRTGRLWIPRLRNGEVTQESLCDLAEDASRNKCIVDHYVRNAGRFGKTFVFACNIDHVNELARMFKRQGIAARGIHSEMGSEENARARSDFASGAIHVLINRDMATHGVDVPDARTIFLCRPTTSDILFSQMVGRGARLAPGKDSFRIVEFTDNVALFGGVLQSAQRYFQGANGTFTTQESSDRQGDSDDETGRHEFDPAGALTWVPASSSIPEALHGLWYRQGQTFGIELELTPKSGPVPRVESAQWMDTAQAIAKALKHVLPTRAHGAVYRDYHGSVGDKDVSRWNVEYDSSAGWEVTTRVLKDLPGFVEVEAACRALDAVAAERGLTVNARTGTHVHLGWRGKDIEEIKRAIGLVRLFEPALASLVAPSRIASFKGGQYDTRQPNEYCRPVSSVFSDRTLRSLTSMAELKRITNEEDARYVTFNLRPLGDIQTVEVRMHHGTLSAQKILLWVSLWQQLLWAAAHPRRELEPVADVSVLRPNRDLIELAEQYLPPVEQMGQPQFFAALRKRRAEIVEQWKRAPELAAWVSESATWG